MLCQQNRSQLSTIKSDCRGSRRTDGHHQWQSLSKSTSGISKSRTSASGKNCSRMVIMECKTSSSCHFIFDNFAFRLVTAARRELKCSNQLSPLQTVPYLVLSDQQPSWIQSISIGSTCPSVTHQLPCNTGVSRFDFWKLSFQAFL